MGFYRVAGCFPLPVQTTSYREFEHREFAPVKPQPDSDLPPCPHSVNEWQSWTSGLDERLRDCGIPSCHVVMIPDGFADANGNVFSIEGRLVVGASLAARKDVNAYYTPTRLYPPTFTCVSAAALTSSQQDNYYHWLMDILPRVHMLRELGIVTNYIYIRHSTAFQRETLELLGVSRDRLIDPARYEIVRADHLVVPFHEVKAGMLHPEWVSNFLRDTVLPHVQTNQLAETPRRIYISRKGLKWRNVLNEDEILEVLASHGFQVVTLNDLPVLRQAALFAGADVVIAPHGAALANLVFAKPGTKVIEFLPRKLQDVYYRLCRQSELPYYYIRSQTGPAAPVSNRQHLTIEIPDLVKALEWAEIR